MKRGAKTKRSTMIRFRMVNRLIRAGSRVDDACKKAKITSSYYYLLKNRLANNNGVKVQIPFIHMGDVATLLTRLESRRDDLNTAIAIIRSTNS